MKSMFGETIFNQPIGSWDVSSVIDMSGMFHKAKFNQPIDSWNVLNVTNMDYMFQLASEFNQPINSWKVGSVTGMKAMFQSASKFNEPLFNWDVSKVQDMSYMFQYSTSFNQNIANWCVSQFDSEPEFFDQGSGLQSSYTPVWGKCGGNDVTSQDFILFGTFNGSNYYYLDQYKTFAEARALAEQFNADLLTITTQEEQEYLEEILESKGLSANYWLGLTDEEVEGQWRWLNGEPFSYSNWSSGEPNNFNNEDYAHLIANSYKWNDWPGTVKMKVILEFK
jgi:surface protein